MIEENEYAPISPEIFIQMLLAIDNREKRRRMLRNQHLLNNELMGQFEEFLIENKRDLKVSPNYKGLLEDVLVVANKIMPDIPSLPELPESLPENLRNIFFDEAIDLEPLKQPVITPQGTTYNKESLVDWVIYKRSDPQNRESLSVDQLRPNKLVNKLVEHYSKPNVDLTQIPDLLKSPKTNKVFEDPVVANDGETCERSDLGENEVGYKNRLVKELITDLQSQQIPAPQPSNNPPVPEPKVEIIEAEVVAPAPQPPINPPVPDPKAAQPNSVVQQAEIKLQDRDNAAVVLPAGQEPKVNPPGGVSIEKMRNILLNSCKDNLMKYVQDRRNDKRDYFHSIGRCFQFSGQQKTTAAENLIALIDGKMSVEDFLNDKNPNLKALKQGRLKKIAKDALEYAHEVRGLKIK